MKKIWVVAVMILVAVAPLGFANSVCESVDSPEYLKAAGAKLVRGIGNVAFSWVEFFRQPIISENKWEGVSKGIGYTVLRTLSGAVEAATFFVPGAEVPAPSPTCPTDLFTS